MLVVDISLDTLIIFEIAQLAVISSSPCGRRMFSEPSKRNPLQDSALK